MCGRSQKSQSQNPQRASRQEKRARRALWSAHIKREAGVRAAVGAAAKAAACKVEAGELSDPDAGKQGECTRLALREVERHSQLDKPRGHLE